MIFGQYTVKREKGSIQCIDDDGSLVLSVNGDCKELVFHCCRYPDLSQLSNVLRYIERLILEELSA